MNMSYFSGEIVRRWQSIRIEKKTSKLYVSLFIVFNRAQTF